MPELPEVETIVRELNKKISGKKIKDVQIKIPKMTNIPVLDFNKKVKGKKITKISRRAKMIIAKLSDGNYLLTHLKMTGQYVFVPKSGKIFSGGHPIAAILLPNKFTHIIFTFEDGSKLFYNDIRKFGWVKYADKNLFNNETGKYGIEPLESKYTFKNFNGILEKYPNRKIKQILMDQSLIAGVGNIYCDEACFRAKIMPTRIVSSLTKEERKKLFTLIPKILQFAIDKGGTSADTYIRTDGTKGKMYDYLSVYGKKGKKCKIKKCQGTVEKIKLNGRGTYYCKNCQK